MKKRSITWNYIYNLIYQLILIVIPLLTTPYLTRILGANNLGIYSYTYSIVTIFFLLSALGINTYGQREIAYVQDDLKKRSKLFWELFFIRIFSTIFSFVLLIIFSFIVSEYSIYYKIFYIYVLANMFDITWLYQGIEDFKNITIRNIIIKLIYIFSIFIFVKDSSDLSIYIFLFSLSTFITNVSFWIKINKIVDRPNFKILEFKKHFKLIVSFFIPQIASLIYTVLDKTMLGIIVPDIRSVSFYEQATYIDKTILTLITTIGTIMISKVSYSYEKKEFKKIKLYLNKVINFVWLFGSSLTFGICATIENFVPWFYGEEYLSVTNLVYIMSPLIIIMGLSNIIGVQFLISTKQQNKYILSISLGSVVNFILNLILIPIMWERGAAISTIVAELLILLIELYYVKETISILDIIKPSIKYLLFGIIMFLVSYKSGKLFGATMQGTLLQCFVGFLIYFLLLIISKDKFLYENFINKLKKNG